MGSIGIDMQFALSQLCVGGQSPLLNWLEDPKLIRTAYQLAERRLGEIFGRFGPQGRTPSIYTLLYSRYRRCAPERHELEALNPSPVVDQVLEYLRELLGGEYIGRRPRRHRLALMVDHLLVERIDGSPELAAGAALIRKAVTGAELAMEYHHGARLTRRLCRARPGARAHGLTSLLRALDGFPQLDAHLELVKAEVSIYSGGQNPKCALVFGAGPFPLTGLLFHALTGARVRLVEYHSRARNAALAVLHELERLGIIVANAVEVDSTPIDELELEGARGPEFVHVDDRIEDMAKLQIARRMAQSSTRKLLFMRSATGLSARLGWQAMPRTRVEKEGLRYYGELIPSNYAVLGLDPAEATRMGLRSSRHPDVLAVTPAMVLKSTDVYATAS